MERLTYEVEGMTCINPEDNDCPTMSFCKGCESPINRCKYFEDVIDKLKAYEDAEEQCIKDCGCSLRMVIEKYKEFLEHMQELAEYWKLEEKGLLLRLPSKEAYLSSGDTVYYIFDYEIVECINCGVSMDWEGKLWIALACDEHIFPYRNPDPEHDLDPTDWCINTTQVTIDEWDKTVFLTEEEAEQALEKMKGV